MSASTPCSTSVFPPSRHTAARAALWLLGLGVVTGCPRVVVDPPAASSSGGRAPPPVVITGVSLEARRASQDADGVVRVYQGDTLAVEGSGMVAAVARVSVGGRTLEVAEGSTDTLLRVVVGEGPMRGRLTVVVAEGRQGESAQEVEHMGPGHLSGAQNQGTVTPLVRLLEVGVNNAAGSLTVAVEPPEEGAMATDSSNLVAYDGAPVSAVVLAAGPVATAAAPRFLVVAGQGPYQYGWAWGPGTPEEVPEDVLPMLVPLFTDSGTLSPDKGTWVAAGLLADGAGARRVWMAGYQGDSVEGLMGPLVLREPTWQAQGYAVAIQKSAGGYRPATFQFDLSGDQPAVVERAEPLCTRQNLHDPVAVGSLPSFYVGGPESSYEPALVVAECDRAASAPQLALRVFRLGESPGELRLLGVVAVEQGPTLFDSCAAQCETDPAALFAPSRLGTILPLGGDELVILPLDASDQADLATSFGPGPSCVVRVPPGVLATDSPRTCAMRQTPLYAGAVGASPGNWGHFLGPITATMDDSILSVEMTYGPFGAQPTRQVNRLTHRPNAGPADAGAPVNLPDGGPDAGRADAGAQPAPPDGGPDAGRADAGGQPAVPDGGPDAGAGMEPPPPVPESPFRMEPLPLSTAYARLRSSPYGGGLVGMPVSGGSLHILTRGLEPTQRPALGAVVDAWPLAQQGKLALVQETFVSVVDGAGFPNPMVRAPSTYLGSLALEWSPSLGHAHAWFTSGRVEGTRFVTSLQRVPFPLDPNRVPSESDPDDLEGQTIDLMNVPTGVTVVPAAVASPLSGLLYGFSSMPPAEVAAECDDAVGFGGDQVAWLQRMTRVDAQAPIVPVDVPFSCGVAGQWLNAAGSTAAFIRLKKDGVTFGQELQTWRVDMTSGTTTRMGPWDAGAVTSIWPLVEQPGGVVLGITRDARLDPVALRCLDPQTLEPLGTPMNPPINFGPMVFSPDGTRLYLGADDAVLEATVTPVPGQPCPSVDITRRIAVGGVPSLLRINVSGTRLVWVDQANSLVGIIE